MADADFQRIFKFPSPYASSKIEADVFITPGDLCLSTLVFGNRWSKHYEQLGSDAEPWLDGSWGDVQPVILINWTRDPSQKVSRELEVLGMDQGVINTLQKEVCAHYAIYMLFTPCWYWTLLLGDIPGPCKPSYTSGLGNETCPSGGLHFPVSSALTRISLLR